MVRLVGVAAAFLGYCAKLVLSIFTLLLRITPQILVIWGASMFGARYALIVAGLLLLIERPKDRRDK